MFWQLPENWVEPPNKRRGGWSGVSTTQLEQSNGEPLTLYVKRQHDHTFRSLGHPFPKSTAWREYKNNLKLKHLAFPVATCVFYQEKKYQGSPRAVMATLEISNAIDLDKWLAIDTRQPEALDAVLGNIAKDVRRLHDLGFEYRALYGNHILLSDHQTSPVPRHFFIDVETVRRQIPHLAPRVRDICQLFRHTPGLTTQHRERFLEQYLRGSPAWAQRFRSQLLKRINRKTPTGI